MQTDLQRKVGFIHLRQDKNTPRGGATIAFEIDADGTVTNTALALCHPNDNFCKRTGRVKAAGRLSSPNFQFVPRSVITVKDFVHQVHEHKDDYLHEQKKKR